jgi:hypothetical protein
MEPGRRTSELVRRVVSFRGIRLGVAVDALVDEEVRRLVGLDVRCGDGVHRFLPLPACELRGGRLQVDSTLVLMEGELDFYRKRGRSLGALRRLPVRRGRRELGALEDLVVTANGDVTGLVVETPAGGEELVGADGVALGPHALRPAV